MDETELRTATIAQMTITNIEYHIRNSLSRKYYIPDLGFGGFTSKEKLLNLVMEALRKQYPEYDWKLKYSLFKTGVSIEWVKGHG